MEHLENYGINAFHDESGYDRDLYQHDVISDGNSLFDAYILSRRGSAWKEKVQIYGMRWIKYLNDLQKEIDTRNYKPSKVNQLILTERGKVRLIEGQQIRDRIVEHSTCDNIIIPAIRPYLDYNNSSSIKGRGVTFTRQEIVKDLVNFYYKHGNDGYVLVTDFRKYYDNIEHERLKEQYRKYIDSETALYIIDVLLKSFEVDVSYLDETDFNMCLSSIFNMLDYYQNIPDEWKTGEKFMQKRVNIGNQLSQSSGILYGAEFDNYIRIRKGFHWFARYSDDSYIIDHDKSRLEELYHELVEITPKMGIHLNTNKTRIVKLSDSWKFLQITYSLTDSGRIMQKINKDRVTAMRRKMKSLAPKLSYKEYNDWFRGWYNGYKKYMSRKQKENMLQLRDEINLNQYGVVSKKDEIKILDKQY